MGRQKILLDSDFLVASFRLSDASHIKAKHTLEFLEKISPELWLHNLVLQESSTVISHRMGMESVQRFYTTALEDAHRFFRIDEEVERLAWNIFLKQTKKGTSFVDCANLACITHYHLDGILSFDTFYPKAFRVGA